MTRLCVWKDVVITATSLLHRVITAAPMEILVTQRNTISEKAHSKREFDAARTTSALLSSNGGD